MLYIYLVIYSFITHTKITIFAFCSLIIILNFQLFVTLSAGVITLQMWGYFKKKFNLKHNTKHR